jgi:hypothetical protein
MDEGRMSEHHPPAQKSPAAAKNTSEKRQPAIEPGFSPDMIRTLGAPGRQALLTPSMILRLQATHGNRFVQRLLAGTTQRAANHFPYQAEMETAFGQDFSDVNVRVGASPELDDLGASAAARGNTVSFAQTPDKGLMAHELTHIVQNRQSTAPPGNTGSGFDTAAEQEAMFAAEQVSAGMPVRVHAPPAAAVQPSRLPADIQGDFDLAWAANPPNLARMFALLKEAKQAHASATRFFFPSNSQHAPTYLNLVTTIRDAITELSNHAFDISTKLSKVIVNGHQMAGLGDLVLARKVAEMLEAAGHTVMIVTNSVDDMKRMAPAFTARIFSSGAMVPPAFRNAKAFVHVGGQAYGKDSLARIGLGPQTQMVKLFEYGFGNQTSKVPTAQSDLEKAFGLGPEEMGIFIDPALQEASAAASDPRTGPAAKAGELKAIKDKKVKEMLFGAEDPPESDYSDYLRLVNLYFSYSHSQPYVNQFINMVLAYEELLAEASKDNIDIIAHVRYPKQEKSMVDLSESDLAEDQGKYDTLVEQGKGSSTEALSLKYNLKYRRDLMESHIPHLAALKIGTVQLITRQNKKEYVVSDEIGRSIGTRTLRLIDPFGLSPEDYNHLLVASGDLTMATGDQSFSQAVSANKIVFYEQYQHKVPLFNSWLKIAREGVNPNAALVRFLETYIVAVSGTGNPRDRRNASPVALRDMLNSPDLRGQFSQMNQLIAAQHNAAAGTVEAVRGAITSANPLIQQRDDMLANITSKKPVQMTLLARQILEMLEAQV